MASLGFLLIIGGQRHSTGTRYTLYKSLRPCRLQEYQQNYVPQTRTWLRGIGGLWIPITVAILLQGWESVAPTVAISLISSTTNATLAKQKHLVHFLFHLQLLDLDISIQFATKVWNWIVAMPQSRSHPSEKLARSDRESKLSNYSSARMNWVAMNATTIMNWVPVTEHR